MAGDVHPTKILLLQLLQDLSQNGHKASNNFHWYASTGVCRQGCYRVLKMQLLNEPKEKTLRIYQILYLEF